MRIISDFKDYYDSAQSLGQDQSLVYIRKKEIVNCRKEVGRLGMRRSTYPFHILRSPYYGLYKHIINVENYTVGFCGKFYPLLKLETPVPIKSKFVFNIEEVDEFVESNYKQKEVVDYYTPKSKYGKNKWPMEATRKRFLEFYTGFDRDKCTNNKMFEEHKCPIILGINTKYQEEVHYNGTLRDVEFYRLFDPYQAFQELSMYLNNIAVPLKPIPKISDEIMSEIKGFDKFSFRKPRSK